MSQALAPGTAIGQDYRLERLLGEGGMGAVWQATRLVDGAAVAIKFVKAGRHAVEVSRRLLREARVGSAIQHPNVVRVYDVFQYGERPAVVMELLSGENLRQKIERERRLSLEEAVNLLLPVISAVGTAHALGVIHRDLKPEYVFLSREQHLTVPRVLEFGVAKLTASEGLTMASAEITSTGSLLGTPGYMAPEQLGGEELDQRADIWSLGVILYEVLSGGRPIEGEGIGQIFKNMMTSAITPIEIIAPELPAEISDLSSRMLARDKADRPFDLRSVYLALEPFAQAPSIRFGPAAPSAR
jgi:eukaryotic-like serine/threonine-protein kinase